MCAAIPPLRGCERKRLQGQEAATTMLSVAVHMGQAKVRKSKPGLILLENREDHRSVAVRAERALVRSFAVKKCGNGTIEHGRLPRFGGSAILSVTDRCRERGGDAMIMRFRFANLVVSIAHFQKFDDVVQSSPLNRKALSNLIGRILFNPSSAGTIHRRNSYRTTDILSGISWRWSMPHYYFDIKDGHSLVDPSGLNLKTDDDAIARAQAIAIMVSIDKPEDDPKRHIAVLNGSREEIFRVPVYSKPTMSRRPRKTDIRQIADVD
jgi:hypothetical protein